LLQSSLFQEADLIMLSPSERSRLRARAHKLHPVVLIGEQGLTEAVLAEARRCLLAHELIKIRVASADRGHRADVLKTLCERLEAAPVQHIGRALVIYRPNPEAAKPPTGPARTGRKAPRATKRSFQSSP
jgi:putative YhbY family RNA-binding protein